MRSRLPTAIAFGLPLLAMTQAHAPGRVTDLPLAGFEDYRTPSGRMENGVLRLTLEASLASWQPWGEKGPRVRAHVFGADGREPTVPGPLIRVTAGTPVYVTLRNTLPDTILVRGLRDRGQEPRPSPVVAPFIGDSNVVAPGESVDVRFTPTVPGSYYYFGRAVPHGWSAAPVPVLGMEGPDRGLVGVIVVDAPGEPAPAGERIFLISSWLDQDVPSSFLPASRFMINGRSWPSTERLEYAQGDTVHWRVINFSGRPHPMHLHGFYFHVDAFGTQIREERFPAERRPFVVTQTLQPTQAMRMSWVAQEPGNWIFHCHFMRHMSHIQHAPFDSGASEAHHAVGGAHAVARGPRGADAGAHDAGSAGVEMMGGLVLGITIRPSDHYAPPSAESRRRLQLHIGKRDRVFGDEPGYGFVLQDGARRPAADSIRFPGSPIVLIRGEPTEIVVHNSADVPLGVHWHGLELESWADGVPGWSGMPGRAIPAIAPGDSLVVRMTPPRAGTFMYHVHSEPGHQLAQGLYGPFLVLEPGERWERDRDLVFLLGSLGTGEDPPPVVNGARAPGDIELRAGTAYRMRFMHISPDDDKQVTLLDGDAPARWRTLARDGADLPPSQVRTVPADFRINVGETYDFLWTPESAGELTLRVVTTFDQGLGAFPRPAPPPDTTEITLRVQARGRGP